MTANVLKDATLLYGGYKLKGYMNSVALQFKADILDNTVFGDTAHVKSGGLTSAQLSAKGFYDPTIDDVLQGDMGAAGIITCTGTNGTEGDAAYLFKDVVSQYDTGGSIGQMLPFSLSAESTNDLVRGVLIANKTGETTDGTGTGFVVAAVGAGQSLSCALHCTALTGTGTLTVTVESDSTSGFSSATTVGSFTGLTAIGSAWLEVGTTNTDTYYRVTWTFTGTSTDFAVAVGVH
jgi:hypothetical protein